MANPVINWRLGSSALCWPSSSSSGSVTAPLSRRRAGRDLNNSAALHREGAIAVGVIVTRRRGGSPGVAESVRLLRRRRGGDGARKAAALDRLPPV